MGQWGTSDASSNSVLWAPSSVKLAPNTTNRDNLYGNTTADAFITGATIGQFAVDANEITAEGGKTAHTGWVLRTEGSGNRAGRVMTEVLVAGGIASDAEDVVYPDYTLSISTQPTNQTANSSNNQVAAFSVVAASVPAGASFGYLWQYSTNNGASWSTTVSVSGFNDQTTDTLTADANTIASNTLVRVLVSATGAVNVTSSSARLTVTS